MRRWNNPGLIRLHIKIVATPITRWVGVCSEQGGAMQWLMNVAKRQRIPAVISLVDFQG
jgi:hypothetical protein